jgi:feruloyl esterase
LDIVGSTCCYRRPDFTTCRRGAELRGPDPAGVIPKYNRSQCGSSKFFGRGGKLLLWHGFDDPGPSPFATIDYYERAVKANGGANLRLFVVPGVHHCMNGPGADTFDPLTAMEQWVENGTVPETMVAKNGSAGFERPVCAWPKLPYYRSGDPASAGSFVCR